MLGVPVGGPGLHGGYGRCRIAQIGIGAPQCPRDRNPRSGQPWDIDEGVHAPAWTGDGRRMAAAAPKQTTKRFRKEGNPNVFVEGGGRVMSLGAAPPFCSKPPPPWAVEATGGYPVVIQIFDTRRGRGARMTREAQDGRSQASIEEQATRAAGQLTRDTGSLTAVVG